MFYFLEIFQSIQTLQKSFHIPKFWDVTDFWWFSRIFTGSWISAQKRDTRAILLKTASVRVSCIQNTQIRGETIAKVFGKVDTFWTYQGAAVLRKEMKLTGGGHLSARKRLTSNIQKSCRNCSLLFYTSKNHKFVVFGIL
jgi:hypothetical protein